MYINKTLGYSGMIDEEYSPKGKKEPVMPDWQRLISISLFVVNTLIITACMVIIPLKLSGHL
jgi:hypothetical protein